MNQHETPRGHRHCLLGSSYVYTPHKECFDTAPCGAQHEATMFQDDNFMNKILAAAITSLVTVGMLAMIYLAIITTIINQGLQ